MTPIFYGGELRADFPGDTWSFEGSQAEMRESTQALWGGFGIVFATSIILVIAPCLYLILKDVSGVAAGDSEEAELV